MTNKVAEERSRIVRRYLLSHRRMELAELEDKLHEGLCKAGSAFISAECKGLGERGNNKMGVVMKKKRREGGVMKCLPELRDCEELVREESGGVGEKFDEAHEADAAACVCGKLKRRSVPMHAPLLLLRFSFSHEALLSSLINFC